MNTTEKNILIAEFLGAENKHDLFEMYGIIECIDDEVWIKHFYQPDEMPFNTDWNWLMQAVKNIESLSVDDNYYSFYVGISTVGSLIQPKTKLGFPTLNCNINTQHREGSKLENTYNACVEFIEWYNKQG